MSCFVFISTPTFDLNGSVRIKTMSGTELKTNSRRITRTATLDGGSVIVDGGFSDSDRTFRVAYWGMSEADEANLWAIFQDYPLVILSVSEGCFSAAIESMVAKDGEGNLTILFNERLSA